MAKPSVCLLHETIRTATDYHCRKFSFLNTYVHYIRRKKKEKFNTLYRLSNHFFTVMIVCILNILHISMNTFDYQNSIADRSFVAYIKVFVGENSCAKIHLALFSIRTLRWCTTICWLSLTFLSFLFLFCF